MENQNKQEVKNNSIVSEKVTIDGFDYYLSNEKPFPYAYIKHKNEVIKVRAVGEKSGEVFHEKGWNHAHECRKVVATTNPNIDIPKVIDEAEQLAKELIHSEGIEVEIVRTVWIDGYNKSQETHPFSEEDVRFMLSEAFKASQEGYQITADEIIQIWKEQPKVIYYNTITQ